MTAKASGTSTADKTTGCETVIIYKDLCNGNRDGQRVLKMESSMSKRGYKRRNSETFQNVVTEGPCGILKGKASGIGNVNANATSEEVILTFLV